MGGRGASYSGARSAGLPNGAVAFTVEQDGHSSIYYQAPSGVILTGSNLDGMLTREQTNTVSNIGIGEFYRRVKASGDHVVLHSQKDFDEARARYKKNREENNKQIAYGELHPQEGKTGIPARKLVYRPRRHGW